MAQPTGVRPAHASVPLHRPSLMAPAHRGGSPADQEPGPATAYIIRSKVQSPVVRGSTIARPRLLDWLELHRVERVRVIAAEAGFGKTTLLADWARRTSGQVRWLRLDPSDAEWTTFISYLIAAFREQLPDFGTSTEKLLGHVATLGTTLEQAIGSLLGELAAAIDEPTTLVIDDLQHVQDDANVRAILERMLERAPAPLTFVLSGRSRPELRLGRLAAQGMVASLGTDDLRFTRQETMELFARGYQMPLDGDLVSVVDERTEGWGASLQLLYSSIRTQRPAEIRDFIHGLRGSREPLYDFLAEEVLDRQVPLMQRVLLAAALLDRIVPPLVVAALSATADSPGADAVVDALEEADELGLMSRNAERSSSRRFHPLLREFLSSHLHATTPVTQLREMHLRVARSAEPSDWPTAAHHYIEAGAGQDAMRVIGESSINALGTGAWGAAMDLVDRIPDIEPSISVLVVRARSLVAAGYAKDALLLIDSIDEGPPLPPGEQALVRLARANALSHTDRLDEVRSILLLMTTDSTTPPLLSRLASSWYDMHVPTSPLSTAESLRRLAAETTQQGLHLYAGLARHNLSIRLLGTGHYTEAVSEATKSLQQFAQAVDDTGAAASARLVIAQASFELGHFDAAVAQTNMAMATPGAQPDVYAEASTLLIWLGRHSEATTAMSRGWSQLEGRTHQATIPDALRAAQTLVLVSDGRLAEARELARATVTFEFDPNHLGQVQLCRSLTEALTQAPEVSLPVIDESINQVARRGMARWIPYLRLVRALVAGDDVLLAAMLEPLDGASDGVLLAGADIVGRYLFRMVEVPPRIEALARRWPERWRPVLRRELRADTSSSAMAARWLATIGEESDVAVLHAWEGRRSRRGRDRLAASLAKRVSPTLRILDLGRAGYTVAGRQVRIGEVRRKAAALLMYLASRPRQVATREQVFESLWPDLDADQAANSLHQTLYFLRRELVAQPQGERPIVEYIPIESELIYLDPDLVHVESVAFVRQASDLMTRDAGVHEVIGLLQSYRGKFAPEFEYEEWAIAWREQTHAMFLGLTEQASRARLASGRAAEATAILRHALEVDQEAYDLKPLMVAALHYSGSRAAARHLYDQYVDEVERDIGERPVPIHELLAQFGPAG